MNSKTEIANAALTEVGAKAITDLDSDTTTQGLVVQRWYSHTKDTLLRAYTWNFALARQSLSQDATAVDDLGEFTNSYTLPTKPYCLRALSMYKSSSEWKIEGRKLLTDDSSVNLKYISRVSNPVEFDDLFTEALLFRLAANIAFPIMRDRLLARELYQIYTEKIQDARTADAQEGTFNVMRSRALTVVRKGLSSPPSVPVSGSGTPR